MIGPGHVGSAVGSLPGYEEIGCWAAFSLLSRTLPVAFDRRVWLECQALVSAGYQVAVVCPKGVTVTPRTGSSTR